MDEYNWLRHAKMLEVEKKRAVWTDETLKAAMEAVQKGDLSQRAASHRYGVPRRTLRSHLKTDNMTKSLGRKTVLTKEQEMDFVERIVKFASIGVPLTAKAIRRQSFIFCEQRGIANNFNKQSGLAGKDWLKSFLKRNPAISKCKAHFLDPAKLNQVTVQQHFDEVKKLYEELDIANRPECLGETGEKGCRLTINT